MTNKRPLEKIVQGLLNTGLVLFTALQLNGSAKAYSIEDGFFQKYGVRITNNAASSPDRHFTKGKYRSEKIDDAESWKRIKELDSYLTTLFERSHVPEEDVKNCMEKAGIDFIYLGGKVWYTNVNNGYNNQLMGGFHTEKDGYVYLWRTHGGPHEFVEMLFEKHPEYFTGWPIPEEGYGNGGLEAIKERKAFINTTGGEFISEYAQASQGDDVGEISRSIATMSQVQLDKICKNNLIIAEKVGVTQEAIHRASLQGNL